MANRTLRGKPTRAWLLWLALWGVPFFIVGNTGKAQATKPSSVRNGDLHFHGPLRVLKANPRYFTDDSGRAIYLTGSHTWSNLQDMGTTDPPPRFDFQAYNVLYEVSNENTPASTAWQFHMIRFIKRYESSRGKSHPVGMTFQYAGGRNATLFASPADWISPNPAGGYRNQPPPAQGRKVVILDTDHLWGEGGNGFLF